MAFQIINSKGQFGSQFNNYLNKEIKGYQVVSIIGAQSTGKSTLMNQLFQTQFQELNSLIDRKQTTQGVWVQCKENLLILDVEGSDSLNRQSDQNFEKYVDLFALSISDIILINIWTTDVGRLSSSQIQILETILEHQIKIWGSQYRKSIIFILRDFDNQRENRQAITQQLLKHVTNSWTRIRAPVEFKDVFDFTVFCLPNFIYCKDAFNQSILELRELVKGINLKNQNVPLRSFDLYCAQIWKTITSRQELNLPNTRILISLFKCQEFIDISLEKLKKSQIDFIQKEKLMQSVSKQYFEQLQDYDQTVVKEKYQYLQTQLQLTYFNEALQFIEKEKNQIFSNIKNELQNLVSNFSNKEITINSFQILEKHSIQYFDRQLGQVINILTLQQIQSIQKDFQDQLIFFIDSYKQTIMIELKQKLIEQLSQQLRVKLKEILTQFESNLIMQCKSQNQVQLEETKLKVTNLFKQLQVNDNKQLLIQFNEEINERSQIIFNEVLQNLYQFAENKLKSLFQVDPLGKSNKWEKMTEVEIRQLNREALEQVLTTLNEIKILPSEEILSIANRINREGQRLLDFAIMSKNHQAKPFYLRWLLLFILYIIFYLFLGKVFGQLVCLIIFLTLVVSQWKKIDRLESIILFFMSGILN